MIDRALLLQMFCSRLVLLLVVAAISTCVQAAKRCEGKGLKYVWGDALTDSTDCLGPNNMQYPT